MVQCRIRSNSNSNSNIIVLLYQDCSSTNLLLIKNYKKDMPRGWPESLRPPPILNLTMKDNLNPSSKSLHRTERPPPLLCHGNYGRVLEREQARLVIKGIATT